MDTVMGIVGDGFCIVAADCSAARSILVFNHSEDKIVELDGNKLMGQSGPQCDTSNFAEYIQKNMTLYELNNDLQLSTHAAANFMRREVCLMCWRQALCVCVSVCVYDVHLLLVPAVGDGPAERPVSDERAPWGLRQVCRPFSLLSRPPVLPAESEFWRPRLRLELCIEYL